MNEWCTRSIARSVGGRTTVAYLFFTINTAAPPAATPVVHSDGCKRVLALARKDCCVVASVVLEREVGNNNHSSTSSSQRRCVDVLAFMDPHECAHTPHNRRNGTGTHARARARTHTHTPVPSTFPRPVGWVLHQPSTLETECSTAERLRPVSAGTLPRVCVCGCNGDGDWSITLRSTNAPTPT